MKTFLFPVFLPFVAWAWLLALVDMALGLSSPTHDTGPTSSAWATGGYFAIIFVAGFLLQFTVGIFGRSVLRRVARLSIHLAFAVAVSFSLSVAAALVLRAPQFGETLQTLLPFTLLFFVPPFLIGHFCAFAQARHPRIA